MFNVNDPNWLNGEGPQRVTSPDGAVTITKCDGPFYAPHLPGSAVGIASSPSSSSSDGGEGGGGGGASGCHAPIYGQSMRELRAKGSSFLRQHASKHGIPNASRKLTSNVLTEIADHYLKAHGHPLIKDEESQPTVEAQYVAVKSQPPLTPPPIKREEVTVSQIQVGSFQNHPLPLVSPNNQHHRLINTSGNNSVSLVQTDSVSQNSSAFMLLPQEPLPPSQLPPVQFQPLGSSGSYTNPASTSAAPWPMQPLNPQVPPAGDAPGVLSDASNIQRKHFKSLHCKDGYSNCLTPVKVRTKEGLSGLGTTVLRPEAASHKVSNASRKPKKQVVMELWEHYLDSHRHEIEVDEMQPMFIPESLTSAQASVPTPAPAQTRSSYDPLLPGGGGGGGNNGWIGDILDEEEENGIMS